MSSFVQKRMKKPVIYLSINLFHALLFLAVFLLYIMPVIVCESRCKPVSSFGLFEQVEVDI